MCGSFWGVEQNQNGGRCHGTKGQKMINSLQTADSFETWHKNRSSLKVVLFVFKIFKMTANIKIQKIQKWKDFNGNGYLQGVRHAAPYCYYFGLLWKPFWIQNGHQNTKNLPIWAWFGFQVDYDVANWYPLFRSHVMILQIIFVLSLFIVAIYLFTNVIVIIYNYDN